VSTSRDGRGLVFHGNTWSKGRRRTEWQASSQGALVLLSVCSSRSTAKRSVQMMDGRCGDDAWAAVEAAMWEWEASTAPARLRHLDGRRQRRRWRSRGESQVPLPNQIYSYRGLGGDAIGSQQSPGHGRRCSGSPVSPLLSPSCPNSWGSRGSFLNGASVSRSACRQVQ